MKYGERIKELRIEAGINQVDIAAKVGKSLSAYSCGKQARMSQA